MAEQRGVDRVGAEEQILLARRAAWPSGDYRGLGLQLYLDGLEPWVSNGHRGQSACGGDGPGNQALAAFS